MELLLLAAVLFGPFVVSLALPGWRVLFAWGVLCALGLGAYVYWLHATAITDYDRADAGIATFVLTWSGIGLICGVVLCALKLWDWASPHRP